jgi:tetratricopeptide (TPR) repeat protein
VKAFADEIETTDQRANLRLAALAATAGAAEALREAERTFSAADKPAALASAAENLIHVRRYEEAAALYQRAGQLSPDAAKMLTLADVLRRTRRHEEVTLDPASPSTPLRRLVLLSVTPKLDALRPLFVAREGEDAPNLLEIQAASSQAGHGVLEGDMPLEAALDLGLAMMRESVSGNDMTGYRVELKTDLPGNSSRVAGFVVREGGEYRIAALDSVPGMLGDQALHLLRNGDLATARQWLDWAREEFGGSSHSSTLSGRTFSALWTKGRQAEIEETRCAAMTIATFQVPAEKLRLLLFCRDAAQAAKDLPRQIAFEEVLTDLYRSLSRYPEMLETARHLATARSDDGDFSPWLVEALTRLRRWDELKNLAERRLAEKPDDPTPRLVLSEVAFATGDLAKGHQILSTFADAGDPNVAVLNQLAWTALFRGPTDERALEWGRRAATLSHYQSAPTLHTLATLYAEQGQTAEAYKVILQSLAARGEAAPTPDDWYVFGRLAEQYGLPEVARGLYRRALPKTSADVAPLSTRNLAEARLAALGPEPRGRRAELRKP